MTRQASSSGGSGTTAISRGVVNGRRSMTARYTRASYARPPRAPWLKWVSSAEYLQNTRIRPPSMRHVTISFGAVPRSTVSRSTISTPPGSAACRVVRRRVGVGNAVIRPQAGSEIVSVSPSTRTDPPRCWMCITATAAPRSRKSSPTTTGAEDFVIGVTRISLPSRATSISLQAAVAERALHERGDRPLRCLRVDHRLRALTRDADPLLAEPLDRGRGELRQRHRLELRVVASVERSAPPARARRSARRAGRTRPRSSPRTP